MRLPKDKSEARFKVRCLGPGAEHTFLSRDPVCERICQRCRDKLKDTPFVLRDKPLPVRVDE